MKYDDIKIDKVQVREKSRKLKARWTAYDEYSEKELEQFRKDREEAFDKWCWDTGSDEDRKRFEYLDKKLSEVASAAEFDAVLNEIAKVAARQIANAIDKSILEDILKVAKINE